MNNDEHNINDKHKERETQVNKKGYKTYYVVMQRKFLQNKFVPVQGRPVKLTGFEEFQFFAFKNGKEWNIGETTTGLLVSIGAQTLKEVVVNTEARLALYKVTKESMSHAIRNSNKAPTEKS